MRRGSRVSQFKGTHRHTHTILHNSLDVEIIFYGYCSPLFREVIRIHAYKDLSFDLNVATIGIFTKNISSKLNTYSLYAQLNLRNPFAYTICFWPSHIFIMRHRYFPMIFHSISIGTKTIVLLRTNAHWPFCRHFHLNTECVYF